MLNTAVSVDDINKAKKFKTVEEAKEYLGKIRNQAEWMKDFKCEIVGLKGESDE